MSGRRAVLLQAAAVLLVPYIVRLTIWQFQGFEGEQATANQWISDVEHALFLLFATIWMTSRRPGWRPLGILTGVVFLYLGVAALALPGYAGSWGIVGGILALLWTGIPLSVSAAIGFIALFGQAVLNGVVIVSHFNSLRAQGKSPREAAMEGDRSSAPASARDPARQQRSA